MLLSPPHHEPRKAEGKRLGRPQIGMDSARIAVLRHAGRSWSEIAKQTGWTKGTVQRAIYAQKSRPGLPKKVQRSFGQAIRHRT